MRYLVFGAEKPSYKICILVNDIRKDEILKYYIEPYGLDPDEIIVISLYQEPGKKKTRASLIKKYIADELIPVLTDLQVEYLIVGDGDYFKTLAKKTKAEPSIGHVLSTEYGPWHMVYVPNYRTVFYNPDSVLPKIGQGIEALKSWMKGTYKDPGAHIIHFCEYPDSVEDILDWLERLLEMDRDLSIDIETFSLKHYDAGIGSIAFAWNQHEGISFTVDYDRDERDAALIRKGLLRFFLKFQRKAIYHNIAFDGYVLIYQLFMADLLDNIGLLDGLETLLANWDDTQLISYLAVNSCARNKISLKEQAQEYAGDYAQSEISDITKIPKPQLLQYNLIDALATWYVFNKNHPKMVADSQEEIYETIFKPATLDIIQMQLTGMPVDMQRVLEVKQLLYLEEQDALSRMIQNPHVQAFEYHLKMEHVRKRNEKLKTKQISMTDDEVAKVVFNPNSDTQLQALVYQHLEMPVIDLTDSKQPSTAGKTLQNLQNHTEDPEIIDFLDAVADFKAVNKINTSFIPALEGARKGKDNWYYLFGFFNLGGTVSGRLSSSKPNLQNLPAGSRYGKLIKSCFKAPPGWFFCGIDFNSLEDRISALTTKDPNKIKVYTDGYDGHSLRAVAYFGDQMPDIDPESVYSVNQLNEDGHKYAHLRQDSKTPTFLLTYGGTYKGMMDQLGWSEEKSKEVEARYHELYKVSDDWVKDKIEQASKDGYITAAFGLRVRTPILAQVIRGTSKTPHQAESEARTAGNALGQSWCLLNSRAGSEVMGQVRKSTYRHDIKPCAQIHDAQYYLVRDDIEIVAYANQKIVQACEWQDHPEIWHDEVKLGGKFSIFWPDWSQELSLPNGASEPEIREIFENHVNKVMEKT